MEQFLFEVLTSVFHLSTSTAALLSSVVTWALVGVVTFGAFLVLYLSRSFNDNITYTGHLLTPMFDDQYLLGLRTFVTVPKNDVLPTNLVFRFNLALALFLTKKSDPFVRMSRRDMDVLQPAIINGFASLFAEGLAAKQLGLPVHEHTYLIALTYEKHDGAKSRKMRVIVETRDTLAQIPTLDVEARLQFERSHQSNRVITLEKMVQHYAREERLDVDLVRVVRFITVYTRV